MFDDQKIAVCIHLSDIKSWDFIAKYLDNITYKFDLFITCSPEIHTSLETLIKANFSHAEVHTFDNIGIFALNFLYLCKLKKLNRYDIVLKLHESAKNKRASEFDKIIFDGLCGTTQLVNQIVENFHSNPNIGMTGTAFQARSANALMYGCRDLVNGVLDMLDISINDWVFLTGQMFWISGRQLNTLYDQIDTLLDYIAHSMAVGENLSEIIELTLERVYGALIATNNSFICITDKIDPSKNEYLLMPLQDHGSASNRRYLERDEFTFVRRTVSAAHWYKTMQDSGLFDDIFYVKTAGLNFVQGMTPIYHFILYGDLLGLDPNPTFNVNYYLISRTDVEIKEACSFEHYLTYGKNEGSVGNPSDKNWMELAEKNNLFNPEWYAREYPDSGLSAKEHYLKYGGKLGRAASKNFNPANIPILNTRDDITSIDCIVFLKYHFRDERQIYELLNRAMSCGDSALPWNYLNRVANTFGHTNALIEAVATSHLLRKEWDKATLNWKRYWQSYEMENTVVRHRSSVTKLTTPVPSTDNLFDVINITEETYAAKLSNKICIYTTLFGDVDDLLPIVDPLEGIDYICFTNRERIGAGWKQIIVQPKMATDNLNAKIFKILPHLYLQDYDYSMFVDANTLFLGRLQNLIKICLQGGDFVMWQHPGRKDLYLESCAIISGYRHPPEAILSQIESYAEKGLPNNTGLLEASFIWRNHNEQSIIDFMEEWWSEIQTHSSRDQLSLGYLIWRKSKKPKIFPDEAGTSRNNAYFVKLHHRNGKILGNINMSSPSLHNKARDIVFLYSEKFQQSGSTILRGKQLCELVAKGYSGDRAVSYNKDTNITDKIVILTKGFLKETSAEKLRTLGQSNVLLADFVDEPPKEDLVKEVDALIASSLCGFRDYLAKHSGKQVFHVTHHVDTRLPQYTRKSKCNFNAGYFGELVNTIADDDINNLVSFNNVDTREQSLKWMDILQNFTFHYATRKTREIDGAKPFLKGFIAAHFNANMMIQKSAGDALYYLGDDYPYLLPKNCTKKEIVTTLTAAKESYGGTEWKYGLEIMQDVKRRSSIDYVWSEFQSMINQL